MDAAFAEAIANAIQEAVQDERRRIMAELEQLR
jgi:hypothetical protein